MDREHPSLSLVRQCALLGVSRSSLYYRPRAASEEDLFLMGEIDQQYLETPFYGSSRMKAWLERRGIRAKVLSKMRSLEPPAWAGEPKTAWRCPGFARVYPRVGGGTPNGGLQPVDRQCWGR